MPTFFDGELIFVHIPKCAGTSIFMDLVEYQQGLTSIWPDNYHFYRMHESLFEIRTSFIEKWGIEKWERVPVISTFRHPVDRAVSWWKFIKKANMGNFRKHEDQKFEMLGLDAITTPHPWITPEDYAKYHRKGIYCHHETDRAQVEEFDSLSFHDFTGRMTTWKESGCQTPNCPYHMLLPQVCWLYDIGGKLRMDNLNLFLVERLGELERFLPEMGKLRRDNATKKKNEDYRDYMTTESLLLLNKLYVEDFKVYKALKESPSRYVEPLLFSKMLRP